MIADHRNLNSTSMAQAQLRLAKDIILDQVFQSLVVGAISFVSHWSCSAVVDDNFKPHFNASYGSQHRLPLFLLVWPSRVSRRRAPHSAISWVDSHYSHHCPLRPYPTSDSAEGTPRPAAPQPRGGDKETGPFGEGPWPFDICHQASSDFAATSLSRVRKPGTRLVWRSGVTLGGRACCSWPVPNFGAR